MSTEENKSTVLRFFATFDTQNFDATTELLAPDVVAHLPGAPGPADRATMLHFGRMFYAAFPDGRHVFDEVIAEGDKVVTRGTFGGTQRGELQGIPPTGKQISFAVVHVDRVLDGKIVEHRGQADMLSMLQQLGAIPTPGQTAH
jgi:predicted ester cyclase